MTRTRNQLRIVGGDHRGRRLHFPDARGLRPTADRVRETLFNWLQGEVYGRKVLDLFAGSGALGLEALSRGATSATFVERARPVADQLRQNIELLGLQEQARVETLEAARFLDRAPTGQFDLVFVDPPFADQLMQGICERLEASGVLNSPAWIYLERDSSQPWPELPTGWILHREGRAGQAAFRLVRRTG